MSDDLTEEVRRLRKQLRATRKALREAKAENVALCEALDMGFLPKTWQPDAAVEREYGPAWVWSYPLRSYLSSLDYSNVPLTRDVCARVVAIFNSVLVRLVGKIKHGLELPEEEHRAVVADRERMERPLTLIYPPCVVCGERRITHDCHIIPRIEGGSNHPSNLLPLCPLHHHLFDHQRLLPDEWTAIDQALENKAESARVYARSVRHPQLQAFWERQPQ